MKSSDLILSRNEAIDDLERALYLLKYHPFTYATLDAVADGMDCFIDHLQEMREALK